MKVKLLKSVDYGFHHAWGPIVQFKKDQEVGTLKGCLDKSGKKFTPNEEELQKLVDTGYAVIIEDEEEQEEAGGEGSSEEDANQDKNEGSTEEDEDKPKLEDLMKKLETITDTNEKKSIIEDWATVNLGIDLDRRKSVPKMLEQVQQNI